MSFLGLKYFLDIVDLGSISAAARANFIAQQSMSAQLKKLEEEYGAPLLTRTAPLHLTAAGTILYPTAKQILRLREDARQKIHALGGETDALVIGFAFGGVPPFFPDLLGKFRESYGGQPPNVSICQNCAADPAQLATVDLYFGVMKTPDFEEMPLLQDRFAVAVSQSLLEKTWPDPVRRQAAEGRMRQGELSAFEDLPFTVYAPGGTGGSETGEPLPPMEMQKVILRTDDLALTHAMCRSGQCAIIVPEDAGKRNYGEHGPVWIFPLRDQQMVPLSVCYHADRPLSESALRFLYLTEEYFRT